MDIPKQISFFSLSLSLFSLCTGTTPVNKQWTILFPLSRSNTLLLFHLATVQGPYDWDGVEFKCITQQEGHPNILESSNRGNPWGPRSGWSLVLRTALLSTDVLAKTAEQLLLPKMEQEFMEGDLKQHVVKLVLKL